MDAKRPGPRGDGESSAWTDVMRVLMILVMAIVFFFLAQSMVHHHFFTGGAMDNGNAPTGP